MIKAIVAAAFVAGSLVATPALAGYGDGFQAQSPRDQYYGAHNNYDYNQNPAFTQGCPQGSVPESFPNGNGRRCALPGGGYSY